MSKSNGSFMPLYLTHSYKNRTVNQQKNIIII